MSTSGLGGPPPRKLRGREAREWEARTAQEAAVAAFYRMDRAQRDTRVQVEAFANLGEDRAAATRMTAEFAEVSAEADERAARYLATLDAHPLEDGAPSGALGAAATAFRQAAFDITGVADRLDQFVERHGPSFVRISAALDRLATHTAAAGRAIEAARAAMADLAGAGLAPGSAEATMTQARAAAAELAASAGKLPVPDAIALADRVTALADRARAAVQDLPRRKADATRRQQSLGTRRDAVAYQISTVPAALRGLRRKFTESSWADVADAEARGADLLAAADDELARAARLAGDGDWEGASAGLTRAGARLDAAASAAAAATGRGALLAEVKADPAAQVAAARFAVRDAQRLVMTGRDAPPQPWAGELDALAERLGKVDDVLAGVHPDFWAFRTELRKVADATADVIRRYRAASPA